MGKKRKIGSWYKLNKLTKAVKITNFKTSFLFSTLAVGYLASAVTVGYFSSTIFTSLLNDDNFVQYDIKDVHDNFPVFVIDGKYVPIYDSEKSLRKEFLDKEIDIMFKDFILNSKFSGFIKYLIDPNPDNYQVLGLYRDLKTTQSIDIEDLQHNQISKNIIYMKFSVSGKEQQIPIPATLSIINTEVFLKKFFEFKILKATQWRKVETKNDIWYRQAGYLPYQYFASSSSASATVTQDLYQQVNSTFEAFIENEKQEFGRKDQTAREIMQKLNYSLQIFKGGQPLNDEFITTKVQTLTSNANLMAQQIINTKLSANQSLEKDVATNQSKFSIGFMPKDFNVEQFKQDASQLFSSNTTTAADFEYLDVYNKYPILPFANVYSDKVKYQTNTLVYGANDKKWNEILNNNYANNFVVDNFDFYASNNARTDFNRLKDYLLSKILDNSSNYNSSIDRRDRTDVNRFKTIITNEEKRFLGGITSITFYDQYHWESWELSNEDRDNTYFKFENNYNWIKKNLANIKAISYTIGAPGLKRKTGVIDSTGAEARDIYDYAQTFFNKAKFK